MPNHRPFGQADELLTAIVLEEYGGRLLRGPQALFAETSGGLGSLLAQVNATQSFARVKSGAA